MQTATVLNSSPQEAKSNPGGQGGLGGGGKPRQEGVELPEDRVQLPRPRVRWFQARLAVASVPFCQVSPVFRQGVCKSAHQGGPSLVRLRQLRSYCPAPIPSPVFQIVKQDNECNTYVFLTAGRMRPAARSRSRTSSTSTTTTRSTSRMRGRERSTGWTRPRPPTPRTACGTSPTWPRRPRRACSRSRANTAAAATGTQFNFVVRLHNWHHFKTLSSSIGHQHGQDLKVITCIWDSFMFG